MIFDALFGSKPKAETETKSTLSPEQEAVQATFSEFLQNTGRRGGNPSSQQPFPGDLAAPLSDLENLSLSALEDRARTIATEGDPNIRAASEALIGILERGPADVDEFISTNIEQPLQEQFERNRTATSARFADQFFGSARRSSDEQNFEDFIDALARESSAARLGIREQDTNATLRAIQLAPQLAGGDQDVLLDLLRAGSVPREVETAQNLGEFERFKELQNRRFQLSQIVNQFLGVPAAENITTVTEGSEGLLGGALAAGASAFGRPLGKAAAAAIL